MNIVFTCTATKTIPPKVLARHYPSKEEWYGAVAAATKEVVIEQLYSGSYWKEVLALVEDFPAHNYFVLSAGLGLVAFGTPVPSYSATVSKRSLDSIPLDWVPPSEPIAGVIATSNEYKLLAKARGLHCLEPSGRRWLSLVGGTGFTLAPRLMRLYLEDKNLKRLYNGLAPAAAQPLTKRIKPTDADLAYYLARATSPTNLRRELNKAGFAISVERAFTLFKTKE